MITIREPTPADAPAIGRAHVRAWQAACRGGLMSDEFLDGLSVEQRAAGWAEGLSRPPRPGRHRLVAETADGEVVGFIVAGPEGDEGQAATGEVYALNIDPGHWSAGYGRTLLAAATEVLAADGYAEAVLWVHPGNSRARRFYERVGWTPDGAARTVDVLDVTVPEVRYRPSLTR